jgi:alkyl hydroperoxide reductase subunit AhpC
MTTGRNFNEILRAIDSIQLTANHSVSTPSDWKQGDDVIIAPTINDEDAKAKFGDFDKKKDYLRFTKQPA